MIIRLIGILFLFLQWHCSFAHPPGLSSADLIIKPDGIDAKITFAVQDIEAFVTMDTDGDAEVTEKELGSATPRIANYVANEFKLLVDGKEVKPVSAHKVSFDNKNNTNIELSFAGKPLKSVAIESKILAKLPPDHKQYITVTDSTGKEFGKKMLNQKTNILEIDLSNPEALSTSNEHRSSSTFTDFLKLGIEHILTGYDHLLFLFSLLVMTRSFWPAIKIITFFTIAHSITLALAGMNIVDISSRIIEPLIAATIIYVGVENIVRKDSVTTRQRCILTFFFGLIHGFGFASVLREMGISSIQTGILVPLFSFNLGVELGQIAVASVVLPLIWRLHGQEKIDRYLVPVGSVLTCLAGGYWLLERTLLS